MRLPVLVLALVSAWTSADAQPKAYVVVRDQSQVIFEATYPLGEFSGTADHVTGEFRLDPDNLPQGVTGSATINPATLRTGIEGRDRDLRKSLETDRYPEIRFTVGEVHSSFPSLAERADIALKISGMMLIRGVERAMTWTGRARIEEGRLWVRGEAELNMTEFGITPPRKFFLAVGDRVRVRFDLRLAPEE